MAVRKLWARRLFVTLPKPKGGERSGRNIRDGRSLQSEQDLSGVLPRTKRRKCQQHKKIYKYASLHKYKYTQHICICSSKSFLRQRKARSTNKMHNLLALSSPQLWAISAFQAKYVLIFKAKFPQRVFFHVNFFPVDLYVEEQSFHSRDYTGWKNWDSEASSQFSRDSEQQ